MPRHMKLFYRTQIIMNLSLTIYGQFTVIHVFQRKTQTIFDTKNAPEDSINSHIRIMNICNGLWSLL